jgi:hypothetical protein
MCANPMPSALHLAVSKLMPVLTDPWYMPEVRLRTNMYHPNVMSMIEHGSSTFIAGFEPLDLVECQSNWSVTNRVVQGATLTQAPP